MTAVPDPEDRPLLSINEVATLFGISRSTAYELAHAQRLPGLIRVSPRRMACSTSAVRRFLQIDPEREDTQPRSCASSEKHERTPRGLELRSY
jgi:excisionase family DNA binding protein